MDGTSRQAPSDSVVMFERIEIETKHIDEIAQLSAGAASGTGGTGGFAGRTRDPFVFIINRQYFGTTTWTHSKRGRVQIQAKGMCFSAMVVVVGIQVIVRAVLVSLSPRARGY
jgi:hypothetical protein